jgi:hypothetical protein
MMTLYAVVSCFGFVTPKVWVLNLVSIMSITPAKSIKQKRHLKPYFTPDRNPYLRQPCQLLCPDMPAKVLIRPAKVQFGPVQGTFVSNANLVLVVASELERNLGLDLTNAFHRFSSASSSSSDVFNKKLVKYDYWPKWWSLTLNQVSF